MFTETKRRFTQYVTGEPARPGLGTHGARPKPRYPARGHWQGPRKHLSRDRAAPSVGTDTPFE